MSSEYHPSLDDPNAFVFYRYHPSLAAAVIFVLAFLVTTFLHCWQCVCSKTWYFIPLLIGGFCEWIGYIGRAMSAKDQWSLGPYILQTMLLLIAPAFFAASIYMVLGRIIRLVDGERHSVIRLQWLTKIFVVGDIISLLAQSAGGGIMSSGSLSAMHTGEKIVIFGLFVQLLFFSLFIYTGSVFYIRMRRCPSSKSLDPAIPWTKYFWVLIAASVSIFVRSVFRLIEYISGNNGYLLKHEIFLYIFDSCLMLLVMVLFNVIHPAELTEMANLESSRTYEMYLTRSSEA